MIPLALALALTSILLALTFWREWDAVLNAEPDIYPGRWLDPSEITNRPGAVIHVRRRPRPGDVPFDWSQPIDVQVRGASQGPPRKPSLTNAIKLYDSGLLSPDDFLNAFRIHPE